VTRLNRIARRLVLGLALAAACGLLLPRGIAALYAGPRWFTVADAPARAVAIVFGAGLRTDGSPMPALEDRIEIAARLYAAGKVRQLLMSGDNLSQYHDEPAAMQVYAQGLGVPAEAIARDDAGSRTIESCRRAYEIFGIREAILVTTDFHLPRALYLCNALGIDAVGVPARWGSSPLGPNYYAGVLREFPATAAAFWELYGVR
jgi:vancomycin permeability regulator SanA